MSSSALTHCRQHLQQHIPAIAEYARKLRDTISQRLMRVRKSQSEGESETVNEVELKDFLNDDTCQPNEVDIELIYYKSEDEEDIGDEVTDDTDSVTEQAWKDWFDSLPDNPEEGTENVVEAEEEEYGWGTPVEPCPVAVEVNWTTSEVTPNQANQTAEEKSLQTEREIALSGFTEFERGELDWQARTSTSWIARRLANAKRPVLIPNDVQVWLTQFEAEYKAKCDKKNEEQWAREGPALRQARHERSILVDTEAKLAEILDYLVTLDHSQPQVIIDCEGLNVSVTGTIDIMELFVRPQDTLYLLDVVALRERTWSTTATTDPEFCLRSFLTSPTARKIMWDCREDTYCLLATYDLLLAGIDDSSSWALFARRRRRADPTCEYRYSIEAACEKFLAGKIHPAEWRSLEDGKRQRCGLPPRPWAIRPLPEALIDYASDVKYMGMLYDRLVKMADTDEGLVERVNEYTEEGIAGGVGRWEEAKAYRALLQEQEQEVKMRSGWCGSWVKKLVAVVQRYWCF